jgi:hypothetical protein
MSKTPETGQPARKRPWFQFHLSSLVLMSIAAGLIMMLNFRPSEYSLDGETILARGWPAPFCDEPDYNFVNWFQVAVDLLCWVAMLAAVCWANERRIDRPSPPKAP